MVETLIRTGVVKANVGCFLLLCDDSVYSIIKSGIYIIIILLMCETEALEELLEALEELVEALEEL